MSGVIKLTELINLRTTVNLSSKEKLTKTQAIYTTTAPIPPIIDFYECRVCTFYIPESKQCELVSEKGEPHLDRIEKKAWCSLWLGSRIPFSWLTDQQELNTFVTQYLEVSP